MKRFLSMMNTHAKFFTLDAESEAKPIFEEFLGELTRLKKDLVDQVLTDADPDFV